MVTKQNRWLEKRSVFLRSIVEASSHIFNVAWQQESDNARQHDFVKQEFVHTEDRNQ